LIIDAAAGGSEMDDFMLAFCLLVCDITELLTFKLVRLVLVFRAYLPEE